MNYSTLGFVIHSKCNAECDICSESCSPLRKEKLDSTRVKQLIESSMGTTIKNIAFTGGEPFLEYDTLADYIRFAKELGFFTSVVTNGYWATTAEKTDMLLKNLINCGLGRLNISYDLHHSKYVDQENINRIIVSCKKNNLSYLVSAVKLKDEKIGSIVDGFSPECGLINFLIVPCEPAGRAKEKFPESSFAKFQRTSSMRCPYNGLLTVASDGNIYPCCAHHVFGSDLSIGHYMDLDVKQMLERIKNNSLLYILRNYGLDPLLNMNESVRSQLSEYVTSECEVCAALFKDGIDRYVNDVQKFIQNHVAGQEKV